ncbi:MULTISPECIES: DMT family transporter [Anaerococcus]|uniref:DMT family transporter n=1 Tax=Anaerococcus TaxID=165779 RepID=UPI00242D5A32|nr:MULTISPECIES: DMT family transporter [Anaerococcus]MDD7766626.1 DMT family transporter [Anaerococcus vaginalis]MDY6126672.1 DMT family transporter [Anaerococcus sp.]
MKNNKIKAIISALLAAVLFAISTPISKKLMENIPPSFMAAFLYLGAGVGVGIMYIFNYKKEDKSLKLDKSDFKYTIAMIGLDILAPLLLMVGIKIGSAANASLLENFEIVATSLIALIIFKEKVSHKLWIAIFFIIISSLILTFDNKSSLDFSIGSIFVLLATISWGLENNCTKKISEKSTYQIVTLKGIFSGLGSLFIGLLLKEKIINYKYIFLAMILGFVAYGLSIFLYVRAQRDLGAAKTSAYYSVAPFVGAFLAFIINGERPYEKFLLALIFMIIGTIFVVNDSLIDNKINKFEL